MTQKKEFLQQQNKPFLLISDKRTNGDLFCKFSDSVTEEMKNKLFNNGFEICDFYYNVSHDFEYFIRHNLKETYNNDFDECTQAYKEQIEGDVYNSQLIKWFSETRNSDEYVNTVLSEKISDNIYNVFQWAQTLQHSDIIDIISDIFKDYYTENQ